MIRKIIDSIIGKPVKVNKPNVEPVTPKVVKKAEASSIPATYLAAIKESKNDTLSREQRAYYFWLEAGCPSGRDEEFWNKAGE